MVSRLFGRTALIASRINERERTNFGGEGLLGYLSKVLR